MSHTNDGNCQKCAQLFDAYPGFQEDLRAWFNTFQKNHPEAHISCAGRGRIEQERDFQKGASKAHYGQSAHNYNCAIDVFVNNPGDLYPKDWFFDVLQPEIPDWLEWGWHWSRFPEMPHLEIAAWEKMRDEGNATLVE